MCSVYYKFCASIYYKMEVGTAEFTTCIHIIIGVCCSNIEKVILTLWRSMRILYIVFEGI